MGGGGSSAPPPKAEPTPPPTPMAVPNQPALEADRTRQEVDELARRQRAGSADSGSTDLGDNSTILGG